MKKRNIEQKGKGIKISEDTFENVVEIEKNRINARCLSQTKGNV